MPAHEEPRTVLLTVEELETLSALVEAKVEAVLVHSQEYFHLQDIAHKLLLARKPPR